MPTKLSDTNYESHLEENKNSLIYFTASWCGPCKKMKPHYELAETQLQNLAPGLDFSFVLVDVDEAPNASTQYSVQCMPTMVLIKDGTVVDRHEGAVECKKILSLIEKHFDVPSEQKPTRNLLYTN